MAGQTPRFNLNFFGGDTQGSLDDDDDKYTSEDRLTLDRVLTAFENHDHHLTSTMAGPISAPSVLLGTAGQLAAGETYYYVISFVNSAGLETVAGDEVSVDTPDLLEAPDAPQGATDDTGLGALFSGQYYYALSGLRGAEESPLGLSTAVTLLTDEHQVTLTLPALDDATSFQVWRMKDDDPGWTRIGTTTSSTFLDAGTVAAGLYGDPANEVPLISEGINNYSVTITLTGADVAAVQDSAGWRIYRTDTSGVYSATSLVHEVVERVDEFDSTSDLLTSWIDEGDAQLTGSPNTTSTQLEIPPYTFESAATLPATTAYPQNYPIIQDSDTTLYVNRSGTWTAIGGGGGGGSMRGSAFFGAWDDPTSITPGYLAGDVVTYNNVLYQAVAPQASVVPDSALSPPPPFASIQTGNNFFNNIDTAYSQRVMFTVAHTVASIALFLECVGTDPINLSFIQIGGPTATASIADPSVLTPGWNSLTLSTPITVNTFDTYVIATSGTGNQANVNILDLLTVSGDVSVSTEVLDHTDTAIAGRYLGARLYEANSAAWNVLGYLVPPGGLSGQVLTKVTGADGDYGWA
jgi:hypothetical protein